MKYVYGAVLTPVEEGFSVQVPDLPGCITGGDSLCDALEMAKDAAEMWLWDAENKKEPIPPSSPLQTINCDPGQIKSLITLDTDEYRRRIDHTAVRKTVSLPSWMCTRAEQDGLSLSQVLQRALIEQFGAPRS